jgi:hypothetical protein
MKYFYKQTESWHFISSFNLQTFIIFNTIFHYYAYKLLFLSKIVFKLLTIFIFNRII